MVCPVENNSTIVPFLSIIQPIEARVGVARAHYKVKSLNSTDARKEGVMMRQWCCWLLMWVWVSLPVESQAQGIEPTDEEQWMLELINRARADPPAEGIRLANHPDPQIQSAHRFFNHDLQKMIEEFAGYPPVPPLAMNLQLLSAARQHAIDMKDNNFQGHIGSDGSDPGQRITKAGYPWNAYGENVYSYAKSVEYGHAGFVADWGVPSLGHRKNTLEFDDTPRYKEVGIGIVRTMSAKVLAAKRLKIDDGFVSPGLETKSFAQQVGPMLITIDYASRFSYVPQVLGVVYADLNQNAFYDSGEGLGGVTLTIEGSALSTSSYSSGGYSIPIMIPGVYTITASGGMLEAPVSKSFELSDSNVKVDFILSESVEVLHWAMY